MTAAEMVLSDAGSTTFNPKNIWAMRIMAAAIVQDTALVALTAFLVLGQILFLKPEVSKVMAAGAQGLV